MRTPSCLVAAPHLAVLSLVAAASAVGCSPADPDDRKIGQIVFEDGPRPPSPEGSRSESLAGAGSLIFGARTEHGGLVVASTTSGAVLAETTVEHEGLRPADLLFDPYRSRLVAVDDNDEGSLSMVTAVPVSWPDDQTAALGAPTELGYLDGVMRMAAMPAGLVGFEESYGSRWRLWAEGAPPTPSVPAPRPSSMWIAGADLGEPAVTALGRSSDGALWLREALVDGGGVAMSSVEAVAVGSEIETTATSPRAAAWQGECVLADVVEGRPAIWRVGADPAEPFMVDVATERVEHVELLREGRLILLLLSSPTRLVAVDRGPVADRAAAAVSPAVAVLDVPADVRTADRFFSRELLVLGDHRVLLATDRGVVSVRLTGEAGSLVLAFDTTFDAPSLRGPLAGPIEAPIGSP